MQWTTARRTGAAVALAVLAPAAPAASQTIYHDDGIQVRAGLRVVAYAASECHVSENHYSPEEYERLRENEGQPLHLWEVEVTVYNGSGRELSDLLALVDIDSEWPPCTNWSAPEESAGEMVDFAGHRFQFQRVVSVAPGEALSERRLMIVFHTDEPVVGQWSIQYTFADTGGGRASAGGGPQSATRSAPAPGSGPSLPGRAGGAASGPAPAAAAPWVDPVGPAAGDALTGPAGMEFVWIPPGEFRMGSTSSEANNNERPVTEVRISAGFWLGKYEVTQSEWESVMDSNPSRFSGCPRCPVERVSWEDVQGFIRRLNSQEGREVYRLPTEAEWEYAARAGTAGDRYGNLDAIAWYGENSGNRTQPVGGKTPNAWGLHDMLGNVWEWVEDWYGDYPGGSVTDPRGPGSGSLRV